ncbi:hypothetical protein [Micromonospora humida]|uniref:MarR family transcriptional regulator n=1 Tax=Micromonospora humida TaxID=2809018 RepID=A0ABS2IUR7_9ACTN|nr:hypothetical protein [Micromonospora humida]MBM7078098.1 hypothetical protein [Micromonospora humida]
MTTAPTQMPGPVVVELSQAEWQAAVSRALDKLHLTYQQLAEMARTRDFSSLEAQKLWMSIGDSQP